MIKIKPSKLIPGVSAVGIYLIVIGLLVFYFNTRNEDKIKNYVKKDEHRIQVALSSAAQTKKVKKTKKKTAVKPKKNVHKKARSVPKKATKKKVIKEKIVKKKVRKKKVITKHKKKNNTKDLFANVKTPKKKSLIKVTDKPVTSKPKKSFIKVSDSKKTATQRINNSLKDQKSRRSGVENAYLAKVQRMLAGWPAQSEYAGEKVKVHLYISPNGFFEFKIKSASRNANFNKGLTEYLEQLQEFGFGRHNGGRTYNFEAEFIAKE